MAETTLISADHGYLVYDTLFALDEKQIEDARAYALYREAKTLSPEETQNAFEAVGQLKKMIHERIEDTPDCPSET